MKDITINNIVYFELTPSVEWSTIDPFTATITSRTPLTIVEKSYIQEALVNAAVKIKERRDQMGRENFYRYEPKRERIKI